MEEISHTARQGLHALGLPEELRSKILNHTPYGNSVKRSIDIFKKEVGEAGFITLIWAVISPIHIHQLSGSPFPLHAYPSWLIEIADQYIDLLKFKSDLPPILIPFKEIMDLYSPAENLAMAIQSPTGFDAEDYVQKCNAIVERFLGGSIRPRSPKSPKSPKSPRSLRRSSRSELVKRITLFFNRVIEILIKFFNDNDTGYSGQVIRFSVKLRLSRNVFPFFKMLFTMNSSPETHRTFIQNINFKEWVRYGKAQKEHILRKLKQENPGAFRGYNPEDDWAHVKNYAEELDEEEEEEEDEKKGGRKPKIRSRSYSSKTRNNNKRTYKKYTHTHK
jgi:hypothetical protein